MSRLTRCASSFIYLNYGSIRQFTNVTEKWTRWKAKFDLRRDKDSSVFFFLKLETKTKSSDSEPLSLNYNSDWLLELRFITTPREFLWKRSGAENSQPTPQWLTAWRMTAIPTPLNSPIINLVSVLLEDPRCKVEILIQSSGGWHSFPYFSSFIVMAIFPSICAKENHFY